VRAITTVSDYTVDDRIRRSQSAERAIASATQECSACADADDRFATDAVAGSDGLARSL
jgi:hypothetical protein